MAPRSIWNGTITFGLVNVPIKLYTATESKTVSFSEVHVKDGAKIEHRRICPKEDKEVDYDEIVKGYEVSADTYVVLEKDEIKAAAGDRGKVVHLDEFVSAEDIDPVFYEKTYYAGSRDAEDAYRLLHEALQQVRARRHRPLHLPRPRVPRGGARARRRDRAAHAALPRRGGRPGRPRARPRAAQAAPEGGRRWPTGSSTRSRRTSSRRPTRTATARRCST